MTSKAFKEVSEEGANGNLNFGTHYDATFTKVHTRKAQSIKELSVQIPPELEHKFRAVAKADLVIPGNTYKSHCVARAGAELLKAHFIGKYKESKGLKFFVIGGTYDELLELMREIPSGKFTVCIGNYSVKDSLRINEGLVRAKSDLSSAGFVSVAVRKTLQSIAKMYIDCVENKKNNSLFTMSRTWPVMKFDVAVGFDSFYYIHPLKVCEWLKLTQTNVVYFTMHMIGELLHKILKKERIQNPTYDSEWWLSDDEQWAYMAFKDEATFSYVHEWKILSLWNRNQSVVSEGTTFLWEQIDNRKGFVLWKGCISEYPQSLLESQVVYTSVDELAYIVDVYELLTYGKMKLYPCERDKLTKLIAYCLTRKDDVLTPQIVMEMIRSLTDSLQLGSSLLQKAWTGLRDFKISPEIIIPYVCLIVALTKVEFGRSLALIGKEIVRNNYHSRDLFSRISESINKASARMSLGIDKALGYRENLLDTLQDLQQLTKLRSYHYIDHVQFSIKITVQSYNSVMKVIKSPIAKPLLFSFATTRLGHDGMKNFQMLENHGATKLMHMLSSTAFDFPLDVKKGSTGNYGLAPGGMGLLLESMKFSDVTHYEARGTHTSFPIMKELSDKRIVYYDDIRDLKEFRENFIVWDISMSNNINDPKNAESFLQAVGLFMKSRTTKMLVKCFTSDHSVLEKLFKDHRIYCKILRAKETNPMSFETYIYIEKNVFRDFRRYLGGQNYNFENFCGEFADAVSQVYINHVNAREWADSLSSSELRTASKYTEPKTEVFIRKNHQIEMWWKDREDEYPHNLKTMQSLFYAPRQISQGDKLDPIIQMVAILSGYNGQIITRDYIKSDVSEQDLSVFITNEQIKAAHAEGFEHPLMYDNKTFVRCCDVDFVRCRYSQSVNKSTMLPFMNTVQFIIIANVVDGRNVFELYVSSRPSAPPASPSGSESVSEVEESDDEDEEETLSPIASFMRFEDLPSAPSDEPTSEEKKPVYEPKSRTHDSVLSFIEKSPVETFEKQIEEQTEIKTNKNNETKSKITGNLKEVEQAPSIKFRFTEKGSCVRVIRSGTSHRYINAEYDPNYKGIQIVQGNLVNFKSDFIVSASNTSCNNGSGIAKAIEDNADRTYKEFCSRTTLFVGQAKLAEGRCRGMKIIVAAGPDARANQGIALLDQLMNDINNIVAEGSITTGVISCGIFEHDKFECLNLIIKNRIDSKGSTTIVHNNLAAFNFEFTDEMGFEEEEQNEEFTMTDEDMNEIIDEFDAMQEECEAIHTAVEENVEFEPLHGNGHSIVCKSVTPITLEDTVIMCHIDNDIDDTTSDLCPNPDFQPYLDCSISLNVQDNLNAIDISKSSNPSNVIQNFLKGLGIKKVFHVLFDDKVPQIENIIRIMTSMKFKNIERVEYVIREIPETLVREYNLRGGYEPDTNEEEFVRLRTLLGRDYPQYRLFQAHILDKCYFESVALCKNKESKDYVEYLSNPQLTKMFKPDVLEVIRTVGPDTVQAKMMSTMFGVQYYDITELENVELKTDGTINDNFVVGTERHCMAMIKQHKLLGVPQTFKISEFQPVTFNMLVQQRGSPQEAYKELRKDLSGLILEFIPAVGVKPNGSLKTHSKAGYVIATDINEVQRDLKKVPICLFNGTAGCGKTDLYAGDVEPKTDLYIAHSNNGMKEFISKLKELEKDHNLYHVRTFVHSLTPEDRKEGVYKNLNYKLPNRQMKRIFIDEAFMRTRAELTVLANAYPNAVLYCFGDKNQNKHAAIWAQSSRDKMSFFQLMELNLTKAADIKKVVHSRISHRFGPGLITFMRQFPILRNYGDVPTMKVSNNKPFFVKRVTSLVEVEARTEKGPVLVVTNKIFEGGVSRPAQFTQSLSSIECQGDTYAVVYIYVDKYFLEAVRLNPSVLFVLFTRCRYGIVFVDLENILRRMIDNVNWPRIFELFASNTKGNMLNITFNRERFAALGYDADDAKERVLSTLFFVPDQVTKKRYDPVKTYPSIATTEFCAPMVKDLVNMSYDSVGVQESLIHHAEVDYNMTVKTNKINLLTKTLMTPLGPKSGQRHFSGSSTQTTNTFGGRLTNSTKIYEYQKANIARYNLENIADDALKKFEKMYIDQDKLKQLPDAYVIREFVVESINEFSQVVKSDDNQTEQTFRQLLGSLTGNLKQQMKAKTMESTFKEKGGQPIAASEKGINILFSPMFRFMRKALKYILKDNFKISDDSSDLEKANWIKEHMTLKWPFEADVTGMDSTQSWLTDFMENFILKFFVMLSRFFGEEIMTDWLTIHSMFRQYPKLRTAFFWALWNTMLGSGMANTMFANILLSMINNCMMFTVEEMLAAIFQGDDTLADLLSQFPDVDLWFFNLFFKDPLKIVSTPGVGEFCNFLHGFGSCIYDPIKFVTKILNKEYTTVLQSKENFEEYIVAIDMMVNYIRRDLNSACKITTVKHGLSLVQSEILLRQFDAFIRLNYIEFGEKLYLSNHVVFDRLEKMGNMLNLNIQTNNMSVKQMMQDFKNAEEVFNVAKTKFDEETVKVQGVIACGKENTCKLNERNTFVPGTWMKGERVIKKFVAMSSLHCSTNVTVTKIPATQIVLQGGRYLIFNFGPRNCFLFDSEEENVLALTDLGRKQEVYGQITFEQLTNISDACKAKFTNARTPYEVLWVCCKCKNMNRGIEYCGNCFEVVSDHISQGWYINCGMFIPMFGKNKIMPHEKKIIKEVERMDKPKEKKPKTYRKKIPTKGVYLGDDKKVIVEKVKPEKKEKQSQHSMAANKKDLRTLIKSETVAEKLAFKRMNKTIDGQGATLRIPTNYGAKPTGVVGLQQRLVADYNVSPSAPTAWAANQSIAMLFDDPLFLGLMSFSNPSNLNVAYKCIGVDVVTENANRTNVAISWTLDDMVDSKPVQIIPSGMIPSGGALPLHGPFVSAVGIQSAIFVNAGSTFVLNTTGIPVDSSMQLVVYQHTLNGKAVAGSINITGTSMPSTGINFAQPGFYTFWLQTLLQGANWNNMAVGVFEFNCLGPQWQIVTSPDILVEIDKIKDMRNTHSSFMLSDRTAAIQNSGSICQYQIRPNVDIVEYMQGDVFEKVSEESGSTVDIPMKTGAFTVFKTSRDIQMEWGNLVETDTIHGLQRTHARYPWELGFNLLCWKVAPQTDNPLATYQGFVSFWNDIEFFTDTRWVPQRMPTYTFEEWTESTSIISRLPSCYTNLKHPSEIFNSIKSWISKFAGGVEKWAPRVIDIATKAVPIAKTIGGML